MDPDQISDEILAMKYREDRSYSSELYRAPCGKVLLNSSWREKICQWSFNVIDHFDLSREIVAVSLDLFDRYLVTNGSITCSGDTALLTSLTTLHIAIKLSGDRVRLDTLASLSRGQFNSQDIQALEVKVLERLGWLVHPPTTLGFVTVMLKLLPARTPMKVCQGMFELCKYLSEIAVCDGFFVPVPNSVIAFASILNVLEDLSPTRFPTRLRNQYIADLARLGFAAYHPHVQQVRARLRRMYNLAPVYDDEIMTQAETKQYQPRSRANSFDSKSFRRIVATVSPISRSARILSPLTAQ